MHTNIHRIGSRIDGLLDALWQAGGTDLLLTVGHAAADPRPRRRCPRCRAPRRSPPRTPTRCSPRSSPRSRPRPGPTSHEYDFSFTWRDHARVRGNAFSQRGLTAVALRMIPRSIPHHDDLGLPPVLGDLALRHQGLVLVTGPTGSGKSTTLASMIDQINSDPGLPHHHDRGPDRVRPRAQAGRGEPARGRHRHRDLPRRPAQRAARGPRRPAGRRDARPGVDPVRAHHRRDRPPGLRHAAHQRHRPVARPHHRRLPRRAAGPGPRPARRRADRRRLPAADPAGRRRAGRRRYEVLVATPRSATSSRRARPTSCATRWSPGSATAWSPSSSRCRRWSRPASSPTTTRSRAASTRRTSRPGRGSLRRGGPDAMKMRARSTDAGPAASPLGQSDVHDERLADAAGLGPRRVEPLPDRRRRAAPSGARHRSAERLVAAGVDHRRGPRPHAGASTTASSWSTSGTPTRSPRRVALLTRRRAPSAAGPAARGRRRRASSWRSLDPSPEHVADGRGGDRPAGASRRSRPTGPRRGRSDTRVPGDRRGRQPGPGLRGARRPAPRGRRSSRPRRSTRTRRSSRSCS